MHRLTYNNKTDGSNNLYGSIWFVDGIKIYLGLHKNIKLTGISDLEIFVFIKEYQDIIDENKSSMLFAKYFKVKSSNGIPLQFRDIEVACRKSADDMKLITKFYRMLIKNRLMNIERPSAEIFVDAFAHRLDVDM